MTENMKTRILVCLVLGTLVLYVASYAILSRKGYASADARGYEGFYFCEPNSPRGETVHMLCSWVYWPLIYIDTFVGFGRCPAAIPMRELSKQHKFGSNQSTIMGEFAN